MTKILLKFVTYHLELIMATYLFANFTSFSLIHPVWNFLICPCMVSMYYVLKTD